MSDAPVPAPPWSRMEPGGIEPREISCGGSRNGHDAQIDAQGNADLARVVRAWPNMPDKLRAVVVAAVDALGLLQGEVDE
ncbi:MAG: hypothetical protein IT430_15110 [Phycisphaerales bacterium]|nr:hypothetical protein [Phycisphaerales bacterium]